MGTPASAAVQRLLPGALPALQCLCLGARSSAAHRAAAAGPAASAGSSGGGGIRSTHTAGSSRLSSSTSGSSSPLWRDWSMLLGFAAAAAWLAQHGGTRAAADAAPAWQAAVLAAAQDAVDEAYHEAQLDHQRHVAQQPGSVAPSVLPDEPGPLPPSVALQDGNISVTIPLCPRVDLAALVAAIDGGVDALARSSSSSSQQQSSWQLSTQQVLHWDLSRTPRPAGAPPAAAPPRSKLAVQLVVPLPPPLGHGSRSLHESRGSGSGAAAAGEEGSNRAHITVVKPGGTPFTLEELVLLRRLVAAANKPGGGELPPFAGSSGFLHSSPWAGLGDSPADLALQGFAHAFGGAVLTDVLAELLQELSGGAEQQQPGSDGQSEPWGAEPGRLGRFFGRLGSRLGTHLGDAAQELGNGDGAPGSKQQPALEQQLAALEALLQQQLAALAPPDMIEWLAQITEQQQAAVRAGGADGDAADGAAPLPQLPAPGGGAAAGRSAQHPQQQPQQPQQPPVPSPPLPPWQQPGAQAAVKQLQSLGCAVFMPEPAQQQPSQQQQQPGDSQPASEASEAPRSSEDQWGGLAGYEAQKQALEDTLLLPLKHPEVYERVSARTRRSAKSGGARPRAVLFEGPPGTGKTSTAQVLAGRASLPLVYVPLEALVSKWYGESEQNLAKVFKACESLGGCIIFLDELDSLATSRDQGDMHEASRRLLGVLLREIDGFSTKDAGSNSSSGGGGSGGGGSGGSRGGGQSSSSSGGGGPGSGSGSGGSGSSSSSSSNSRSVVIGATNRRQDLDHALLSRFDLSIHFGLPDERCRAAILAQYAHHLTQADRQALAVATPGFSGRDLRDVCEQTERTFASRIIRGQVQPETLPALPDYMAAVEQRIQGAGGGGGDASGGRHGRHGLGAGSGTLFRT